MLREMQNKEDAEEVLGPAEEVGDEAFATRGGREGDGPFEAGLKLEVEILVRRVTCVVEGRKEDGGMA